MNPAKVKSDTKRNPETDFDDNLSKKSYPREKWTRLHCDMNPAKVLTDTKRNTETVYDDNPSC